MSTCDNRLQTLPTAIDYRVGATRALSADD